jgi:hypothetical protein
MLQNCFTLARCTVSSVLLTWLQGEVGTLYIGEMILRNKIYYEEEVFLSVIQSINNDKGDY